jgi:hypothetical protein
MYDLGRGPNYGIVFLWFESIEHHGPCCNTRKHLDAHPVHTWGQLQYTAPSIARPVETSVSW